MSFCRMGGCLASLAILFLCCGPAQAAPAEESSLKVSTFVVDATPPVGSILAYDTMEGVDSELSCRGIVIQGRDQPIVLVVVDWIGIGNGGQDVFKEALAEAVGTIPDRVAVHCLHQHDAPRCDFAAEEILLVETGQSNLGFNVEHAKSVVENAARAARDSLANARTVTHIGTASATVDQVASNRRILGPDGKVAKTRFTATRNAELRAMPVGEVDDQLKLLSFHDGDEVIAALTYFATHPQSYYRTKLATVDFPGMARNRRQEETKTVHVHFNGAGGDIGAGKWNEGTPEHREALVERMRLAMETAWNSLSKIEISSADLRWEVAPVSLPLPDYLQEDTLLAVIHNRVELPYVRFRHAAKLAWLRRNREGRTIPVACLHLGDAKILHLPGELLVAYQLAAQAKLPDQWVAMAAYGDMAPGYIGTEIAYSQGGYETSERASNCSPAVEGVLMEAISRVLQPGEAPSAP